MALIFPAALLSRLFYKENLFPAIPAKSDNRVFGPVVNKKAQNALHLIFGQQ